MSDQNSNWLDNVRFVAHEMKTPVSAINGFIELAENSGPLTDSQAEFLGRAKFAAQRILRLADVLLEAARIDAGKPLDLADVDMQAVIQHEAQLLEPLARQMQVDLHIEVSPDIGLSRFDQERLGHAISNLISNAIKYNKRGGEVWINVRGDAASLLVEVRDNGRGIKPEDRPHVFDRFFRSRDGKKTEGTGLGLYIVRELVQLHQGEIDFESEVDVGTTFRLRLPRHFDVAEAKVDAVTETPAAE
ncbi:MAG: HAMP domain-containing histidine kinase [Anaerolineae bacterium]|nr:HAMP domain-containing histidine kinase [Anaerolineae bacterium]